MAARIDSRSIARAMCEVGDGAMSVLEIERIEEFLRFLLADLLQRLLH